MLGQQVEGSGISRGVGCPHFTWCLAPMVRKYSPSWSRGDMCICVCGWGGCKTEPVSVRGESRSWSLLYPWRYPTLPTWPPSILWNCIEKGIKASICCHIITSEHHCQDVWGGEKYHSWWGTELPHGQWRNSGAIEDLNWVVGTSKDIFQAGGTKAGN